MRIGLTSVGAILGVDLLSQGMFIPELGPDFGGDPGGGPARPAAADMGKADEGDAG